MPAQPMPLKTIAPDLATAQTGAPLPDLSIAELVRAVETLRGSGQANVAALLYQAWIERNPADPLLYAVLFNYSVVLSDAGKLDLARDALERATVQNPGFAPAHINLGRIYERQGDVAKALGQWSAVLGALAEITGPTVGYKTTALNQTARVLETAGQDPAAEAMLKESLDIDPHQTEVIQHWVALRQRQCKWPVIVPSERASRALLTANMSPLSMAIHADDPRLQLAHARHYNQVEVGRVEVPALAPAQAARRSGPLRIGYLSSDLREHAVGFLMRDVFALHDRTKVEVSAYYCGVDSTDPLHLRFKASADHWTPISGMDDASAARRIADDGIHILVDLNGYTRDARLKLVAHRPAPVIVNWLGYPGTMGSPYHQYIIADDWVIPHGDELCYSEKVLRLPCYQPNPRERELPTKVPTRSDAGLPENDVVFCCFNGSQKITRVAFERWLAILTRVPRSVLWLLDGPEGTRTRLRDYASARGISGERLVFAPKLAHPLHLVRHRLADLFLDTTPYGAHTTASDALWMGVPVLTLSGRSFASRVCGSLVRAAGIPELVCSSPEEFVERAVAFGSDPPSLAPFRERLRETRDVCPLFDVARLVRGLEDLYEQMWSDLQRDELPQPNLGNLDTYLEAGSRIDHETGDAISC